MILYIENYDEKSVTWHLGLYSGKCFRNGKTQKKNILDV